MTMGYVAGGLTALLAAWIAVTELTGVPDYLVPSPAQVGSTFIEAPDLLVDNTKITVAEVLVGLAAAAIFAVIAAVAITSSRLLRIALYPMLVATQSAPKEALAPIFVIWWGYTMLPKIVMAALIAFFPMVVATVTGFERFTEQQRLLAASMGAGQLRTLFSFRLRVAVPSFMSGLRLGITLAVVGAVLGEFLGSDNGLGYLILSASRRFDGGLLYASLIILIIATWALVRLVDLAENVLMRGARTGHVRA